MTTPATSRPEHGGTDAGPTPVLDLSTNANPYGPSPAARSALAADVGPYPDPAGTATIAAIAAHHDLDPDTVVLGGGATELIDRLVRVVGGPVLVGQVDFGEYAAAAERHGHPVLRPGTAAYLDTVRRAALLFVASPHNPTGQVVSEAAAGFIAQEARAAGTTMVWDLAYAPMVEAPVHVPEAAVRLHAPNKAHGCTGIRAGWLQAPPPLAARLRAAEVTWSVSAVGHAFLTATASDAADGWVARSTARLRRDGDVFVAALREHGLAAARADAPFAVVQLPHGGAREVAALVRASIGVKVRPTDSLGLPGALRIAPPPMGAPVDAETLARTLRGVVDTLASGHGIRTGGAP